MRVRRQVIEHWANRDDLDAKQLGWVPPTPIYLVRMMLAERRGAALSVAGAPGARANRPRGEHLSGPTPTLWIQELSEET